MRLPLLVFFLLLLVSLDGFAEELYKLSPPSLEPTLKVFPTPELKIAPPAAMAAAAPAETSVTLEGTLVGGQMAIGGDTTGWILYYQDQSGAHNIEVDLGSFAGVVVQNQVARITGTIVTRNYIERGAVSVLVATQVTGVP